MEKYDLLITGTSIENKLELENINAAKKLGIYTVTFLDHWTNYKKRFLIKKKIILPNEIIYFDKTSFLLNKIFYKNIIKKTLKLSKVNNTYFQTVRSKKKK